MPVGYVIAVVILGVFSITAFAKKHPLAACIILVIAILVALKGCSVGVKSNPLLNLSVPTISSFHDTLELF